MSNWLLSIVSGVITPFLNLLTPVLKEELDSFIQSLYTKAKATSSPLDDVAVKLLAEILGVDVK